ncbi:hypothetical protein CSB93_2303 [Pseudomonas paraeruginosa]|uniref:Uncharacterized protein n=1 Tax=Pseudomonas paraeruginosa TaxID=2994495 RepID=A0A2R3INJ8_9PSED|nr:hypothetical protein CSB93_2303 [Pseudomonas paraeruginosa]AWE91628.1 hypothetical protein CSC28_1070 [Pseudomonas paraeruginosa]PTC38622.1 hypothetical protein CLJ1_0900 [Pseudomonas aeruginosa]
MGLAGHVDDARDRRKQARSVPEAKSGSEPREPRSLPARRLVGK